MKKITLTLSAFLFTTLLSYHALSEAAIFYEMQATDTMSRAELAYDVGLGLLAIFFITPGSLVIGTLSSWFTWRKCKLKQG